MWTDKPKFIPYAITSLSLGAGVVILVTFLSIFHIMAINVEDVDPMFRLFAIWFAGLPILLFLWNFFRKIFSYSNTIYAFTNKRVMVTSGFIGTGFKIIDYDKISDIQVSINLVERAFHVGTTKFYSGRTETNEGITTKLYDSWEAISNPYEVFKRLKTVSVDIKTDFNYPNAFRPDTNPGYNTRYHSKNKGD